MELNKDLKNNAEKEEKDVLAEAGMLLNDEEVSEVAGGSGPCIECPYCGWTFSSQEKYDQHKNKYHWGAGDPAEYNTDANRNYRVF